MNTIFSTFPITGYLETKKGGMPVNQDCLGYADTPFGFLIVLCDGIGQETQGREASTEVVKAVVEYVRSQEENSDRKEVIAEAIKKADKTIHKMIESNPELDGIGSTLVTMLINPRSAIVGNVGECNFYQIRSNSIVNKIGGNAAYGGYNESQNMTQGPKRVINGKGMIMPQVEEIGYKKGDRFALCTDGVWNVIPEGQLAKKISKAKDMQDAVIDISTEADEIGKAEGGHHDNITIALIETQRASKIKATSAGKISNTAKKSSGEGQSILQNINLSKILIAIAGLVTLVLVILALYIFLGSDSASETDTDEPTDEATEIVDETQSEESDIDSEAAQPTAESNILAPTNEESTEAPAPQKETQANQSQPAKPTTPDATKLPTPENSPYKAQINSLEGWIGSLSEDKFINKSSLDEITQKLKAKKAPQSAIDAINKANNIAKDMRGTERTAAQKKELQNALATLKNSK